MDFFKKIINALENKWVADLPDLTLLINKIDELCDDFDPTQFVDSELYIEKLMKMSKELRKKKKINRKDTNKFLQQQNHCVGDFFLFFCFYFLFDLLK